MVYEWVQIFEQGFLKAINIYDTGISMGKLYQKGEIDINVQIVSQF